MNRQFDVIIVGDSKSGNDTVKAIAVANQNIKIAFISRAFKSTTTRDFLNVEYIKEEVVFTDYKNRLFGCYLKNGDRLYCTHMVIATGLAYSPFMLNNKQVPCVFNNTEDILKSAKSQPALVIGQKNTDIKFALAVAKKYKQVYFCTEAINISDATAANTKKLSEAANIVVLPNTKLKKVNISDGILNTVELNNYSTIRCSAIFIKTDAKPEVFFVSDKLIQKDDSGYLITHQNLESCLVPKCFAIGNCVRKSTKKMFLEMIDTILKDFKKE